MTLFPSQARTEVLVLPGQVLRRAVLAQAILDFDALVLGGLIINIIVNILVDIIVNIIALM